MSNLLLDEYPLVVLPRLATLIGLNEAIFLQQLNYWLRKSGKLRDGQQWIYKTYDDWQAEDFPFWSTRTIKRIVENLRDKHLILTTDEYNKSNADRTLWYAIVRANVDKLDREGQVVTPTGQVVTLIDRDKLARSYQRKTTSDKGNGAARRFDDTFAY